MRKILCKLISIFLILITLCNTSSVVLATAVEEIENQLEARAVSEEKIEGDFKYQIIDNAYVGITRYISDDTKDVVIPDRINNLPVTTIGEKAFEGCYKIIKITIPNSVTSIGRGAFMGCYNLTDITIPNSIRCLEAEVFSSCYRLTNITIPDSVTSIRSLAFSYCLNLTNISIPASVTFIDGAFINCSSLVSIDVDINNDYYISIDGIVFNKDKTKIVCYPAGKKSTTYNIPNSVISIGECAFSYCSNLTNITIPNSVTSIGNYAFANCSNLTNISIPASVTTIESQAFICCDSLISIIIPSSVTSIEIQAFAYCPNLTSVTILNKTIQIDVGAFENKYLKTIYGYSDSTAEKFARENNITFISLDKNNEIIKNINNKNYVLTIIDPTGKRLSDQTLKIDDVEYNCTNGIVQFNKNNYEQGQKISVELTWNNTKYILQHELRLYGQGTLRIPKNSYELTEATANEHDILTASKILNLAATEELIFKLKTTNEQMNVNYKVYQSNRLLATESGISEVSIKLKTNQIKTGQKLTVKICDLNDNVLSSETLKLTFILVNVLKNDGGIELGDDIKITFPNDMAIIGGAEFTIPTKNKNGNINSKDTSC